MSVDLLSDLIYIFFTYKVAANHTVVTRVDYYYTARLISLLIKYSWEFFVQKIAVYKAANNKLYTQNSCANFHVLLTRTEDSSDHHGHTAIMWVQWTPHYIFWVEDIWIVLVLFMSPAHNMHDSQFDECSSVAWSCTYHQGTRTKYSSYNNYS